MGINYSTLIITIINFAIYAAIIFAIYRGIKSLKNFLQRNREMTLKLDTILNKLEDN